MMYECLDCGRPCPEGEILCAICKNLRESSTLER